MLGVLVDLKTAGKETSHVTVYDAGDAVTHCCYPSAATSQFLFFELVYQSGWPFFWNEKVKMLPTLSVRKFLSRWQRRSESLPNLRFRTPPARPPRGGHLYAVPTVWGNGPPPAVKRACIMCSWTFLSKVVFFFKEELLLDHMSLWEIQTLRPFENP